MTDDGTTDWSTLAHSAAEAPSARRPRQYEPSVSYIDGSVSEVAISLREIPADEAKWREEIQRVTQLTIPEGRKVELTGVRYWGNPHEPMIYCRFAVTDRQADVQRLDLEDLIAAAKKVRHPKPPKVHGTDRSLVVAWADLQVGKVGSRGGTQELIGRVMQKLDALDTYAREKPCDTVYLIDMGDCVESFENVPSQGFTNDLSFPEQLRVARRLFTEAAMRLARTHSRVVCAAVPSNHGQWRRGKAQLGRPSDDFGIETLTAVADAFALNPKALGHVEFIVPAQWDESFSVNAHGTILAAVHGHQVTRPDGIPGWWAGQVHGGQPAADADILLTAHFHCARIQPSGRSAHTGRAKWWFQAPTLDNGSDWWRLSKGSDSDPALLAFTVSADGWDNYRLL